LRGVKTVSFSKTNNYFLPYLFLIDFITWQKK
jgi:hypothetical protein